MRWEGSGGESLGGQFYAVIWLIMAEDRCINLYCKRSEDGQ